MPRPQLAENLRRPCGEAQDGLRGRLPDPDALTIAESLSQWVEAEAGRACERARADHTVSAFDEAAAQWEQANGRR